jgi:type II restriction enzyme
MSKPPKIQSFVQVEPMIYAYNAPDVSSLKGYIKIGYTAKQRPEDRIKQQTRTAGLRPNLLWKQIARYTDNSGENFRDTEFHAYLETEKSVERLLHNGSKTEWFKIDRNTSRDYFDEFAARGTVDAHVMKLRYKLRDEQAEAVRVTKSYFESGGKEFLWNAKPRFGKTLTAYDLVVQMAFSQVRGFSQIPCLAGR